MELETLWLTISTDCIDIRWSLYQFLDEYGRVWTRVSKRPSNLQGFHNHFQGSTYSSLGSWLRGEIFTGSYARIQFEPQRLSSNFNIVFTILLPISTLWHRVHERATSHKKCVNYKFSPTRWRVRACSQRLEPRLLHERGDMVWKRKSSLYSQRYMFSTIKTGQHQVKDCSSATLR